MQPDIDALSAAATPPERLRFIMGKSGIRLWTEGEIPQSLADWPVHEYVPAAQLAAAMARLKAHEHGRAALATIQGGE